VVRIRNPRDFWAGALFVAFGMAAVILGSRYNLGTAARMGPGYFPRILGILLIALGAIISARGSTVFLIMLASVASSEFRWKEALVSGVLLAVLAVAVFILGLKLQLPIWPVLPG
jgi:putative tricarboxylic transport membrane protein